jgi:hypothetical protein
LFVADTRVLSCWRLAIDGEPVETLTALENPDEPYRARFMSWPYSSMIRWRNAGASWSKAPPVVCRSYTGCGSGLRAA